MSLKVMTFNILFGGGDNDRFTKILNIITITKPDILILQECLGWEDSNRLEQVATVMQIPFMKNFAFLGQARPRGSGKRYNVAIFSHLSMQETVVYNDANFLGHCIIKTSVSFAGEEITIFATHFDSHNENLRFVEARYLRSLINKIDFQQRLFLLAGDLNSLSTKDPYPSNFTGLLKQSNTLKYNIPPRFDVIEELESFGWIDTLYYKKQLQPSWITAPRDRGGVKINYRTDYIFTSTKLAEHLQSVEIIDCGEASDHFPVIANFF
jgi:exodeoxyribonuclease-3